jgi:hypothetical protein
VLSLLFVRCNRKDLQKMTDSTELAASRHDDAPVTASKTVKPTAHSSPKR